jgi:hypothetical protein
MFKILSKIVLMMGIAFLLSGDTIAGQACFRGRPLPECRTFWITEAGVLYRFNLPESNHNWHETLMFNWELGLMFNRSKRYAIGGSFFLNFDDYSNNTLVGFRPRYRHWLSPRISLDIAPGIILSESKTRNFAFSGEVMLGVEDIIAAVARLDLVGRESISANGPTLYGGLIFRSYPGLIIGLAGPIIAAIIFASEFNSRGRRSWG